MSARFSDGSSAVNGPGGAMTCYSLLCAGLCHLILAGGTWPTFSHLGPTPQPPPCREGVDLGIASCPLADVEEATRAFTPSLQGGGWGVGLRASDRFEFESKHMGTTFRVVLFAADRATAKKAAEAAFARVAELDGIMSDYKK